MIDSFNGRWHEILDTRGKIRPLYAPILERIQESDLRDLEERSDATLRELGATFELPRQDHKNTWFCDLLPHVFLDEEWEKISRGFEQRVRAFEFFLRDAYGEREILQAGVLPIQMVLGSPHFQRSAVGLTPTMGHFLHLSSLCLVRDRSGELTVKNHYFSHASGLAYMMQNRRILTRVLPDIFRHQAIAPIADVPTQLLLGLRGAASVPKPTVVLLTPGVTSAVYSEHSFLAQRMGIPLVQGGDLVVLDDTLFLKTVSGLERIDVVYSRVADPWLDPLVFKSCSLSGVPGLVQCLRRGRVALVNSVGAQLADDRSLLHFANTIVRFYLGERPLLPTLETFWLGDLDQREMVTENLDRFEIRGLGGEKFWIADSDANAVEIRTLLRRVPQMLVAQPRIGSAETLCIHEGQSQERLQDHLIYGMQRGESFEVFAGGLTRVSAIENGRTESEHGGGGKDTWVLQKHGHVRPQSWTLRRTRSLSSQFVTSRVAEAFYWLGRYLERAHHVARIIHVIETVEMEELNSAERKLYKPVWNRLLPPVENGGKRGHRSISNVAERYRMMVDGEVSGSVSSMIKRGWNNAESLREVISPEARLPLIRLRSQFLRQRMKEVFTESESRRTTRRLVDAVITFVPQFFATAEYTMLASDGWRFCQLGQFVERAATSAHATFGLIRSLVRNERLGVSLDIELSAFLRLLGSRDSYRRVFQNRSEPAPILELFWQNDEMPRSVTFCLNRCIELIGADLPANAPNAEAALRFMKSLLQKIEALNWYSFFVDLEETDVQVVRGKELPSILEWLLVETRRLHVVVSDHFLNHQQTISEPTLF